MTQKPSTPMLEVRTRSAISVCPTGAPRPRIHVLAEKEGATRIDERQLICTEYVANSIEISLFARADSSENHAHHTCKIV